jgi:hypothetical protein
MGEDAIEQGRFACTQVASQQGNGTVVIASAATMPQTSAFIRMKIILIL